jgi:hypothetical protein
MGIAVTAIMLFGLNQSRTLSERFTDTFGAAKRGILRSKQEKQGRL